MATQLTEEEMRQALFGSAASSVPAQVKQDLDQVPVVVPAAPTKASKRRTSTRAIPRLKVTLRVGNEFEGETQLFIHEADTLSTLQAEMDATKAARKKFRYVDLVSVIPEA